jgi:hypothetical protein
LGRADQQVKIRGFRIEPGEIEAALLEHDHVQQAVVTAREDDPGGKRLVAYVVGAPDATVYSAELRDYLKPHLPDYMIPSAIVVLDALPLTPNGKLDRQALPAPEERRETTGYVAPRTPVEGALASIWAEVLRLDRVGVRDELLESDGHSTEMAQLLRNARESYISPHTSAERVVASVLADTLGLERVGIDDNFFELGGHSLLALRVVARISSVCGVDLPVRVLLEEATTVRELARKIEGV